MFDSQKVQPFTPFFSGEMMELQFTQNLRFQHEVRVCWYVRTSQMALPTGHPKKTVE